MGKLLQNNSFVGDKYSAKCYAFHLKRQIKAISSVAALTLIFLTLSASLAVASHFKGGSLTYKYLGGGRYEFLIKGYWGKGEVGSINPRYQNFPVLSGAPVTVSQTLLPDGKTVEHVQKQTVTWSEPGHYEVSWKTCCRSVGSNFDNNPNGLFAAVTYNPNVPSSSPQFNDYPLFDFISGQPIERSINAADPDGHEQEYALQVPYGLSSNVYDAMIASGFKVEKDGTIKWANPLEGKWLVNIRLREKIDGNYTGAYLDRDFIINITAPTSNAPVFAPLQNKTVREGQPLSFEVEASDPAGFNIMLTAYSALLSSGASFVQTVQGNVAKGIFNWTPGAGTTGAYKVQFVAANDQQPSLSSQASVGITVEPCNVSVAHAILAKPCAGSSNGHVSFNAADGVSPYSYSLDNGATYQSSSDFKNLAAGNYTVLVKDAIGCISEPVTFLLEEAPLPIVTLDLPASLCANAGATALTGGYPAGGVYSGAGVENGFFYPERVGVGSHTIYYSYTDGNGCNNSASDEITVNELPVADAGPDQNVVGGRGSQSCTTLTANATGGSLPYTYYWSTGEITQSINVCPTDTTTYTVTVTDALGCSSTSQVTVNFEKAPSNGSVQGNKPQDPGPGVEPPKGGPKSSGGITANSGSNAIAGNKTHDIVANLAEIIVSPNPVTNVSKLTVRLQEADIIAVDIIDLSGKIVKKLYVGNISPYQELSFDISRSLGLKSIYIGRVTTSKGVLYTKLIIQ